MQHIFACPLWGLDISDFDACCARIKAAGYDAVEGGSPVDGADFFACLDKHGLQLVGQQWTGGANPEEHIASMRQQIEQALPGKPLLINFHAGKDWWPQADNIQVAKAAVALSQEYQVPIALEIHRGRMTFCSSSLLPILDAVPELQLTADLSHWCCVAESLLHDQADAVARAIKHSVHIHARVGHAQGPQVNDPRAPEHAQAVEKHLEWWDAIRSQRAAAGAEVLTITPEFGPSGYLPTLPYTQQPVASQWDINLHIMQLLRQRWA